MVYTRVIPIYSVSVLELPTMVNEMVGASAITHPAVGATKAGLVMTLSTRSGGFINISAPSRAKINAMKPLMIQPWRESPENAEIVSIPEAVSAIAASF